MDEDEKLNEVVDLRCRPHKINERAVPSDGCYEFERAERNGAVSLRCGLCLKTCIILFKKLIICAPLNVH